MARRHSRDRGPNLGTGLLLMTVGLAFLLDQLNLLQIERVWRAWPVLLIGLGLIRLVAPRWDRGSRGWGVIFVLEGLLFLAIQYGWMSFTWHNAWPVMIMIVGVGFIVDALLGTPARPESADGEVERRA